ncbi:MAG: hypothetical protein ACTSXY_06820 [Promethearchaeota archaeon]
MKTFENFILGIVVGIIISLVFIVPFTCHAESTQSITFNWTYSEPPTDLAGFHLWRSDTPDGNYTIIETFSPLERIHVIDKMTLDDKDNYFALSAFDDAGQDSGIMSNGLGNLNPTPNAIEYFTAEQTNYTPTE